MRRLLVVALLLAGCHATPAAVAPTPTPPSTTPPSTTPPSTTPPSTTPSTVLPVAVPRSLGTVSLSDIAMRPDGTGVLAGATCQADGRCLPWVRRTSDGGRSFPLTSELPSNGANRVAVMGRAVWAWGHGNVDWSADGHSYYGSDTISNVVDVQPGRTDAWALLGSCRAVARGCVTGVVRAHDVLHAAVPIALPVTPAAIDDLDRVDQDHAVLRSGQVLWVTHDDARTWQRRAVPSWCARSTTVDLAAATGGVVWLVCQREDPGGEDRIYVSADTGRHFRLHRPTIGFRGHVPVLAIDATQAVIGGHGVTVDSAGHGTLVIPWNGTSFSVGALGGRGFVAFGVDPVVYVGSPEGTFRRTVVRP